MDERILLLVDDPREAQAIVTQLAAAGIAAQSVSPRDFAAAIRDCTLGAALLTEEALDRYGIEGVTTGMAAQPAWSDCPVLLLTHRDNVPSTDRKTVMEIANITIVERPLHTESLVTAARGALRARARQRKAQVVMEACDAAQAQVRALAASLEARVIERTSALNAEMQQRALAEVRLRESEELYRLTLDLNDQIAWSAAGGGAPLLVGERLYEVTGLSFEKFASGDWSSVAHPDDLALIGEVWERAGTVGAAFDVQFRVRRGDGNYRWVRSRGAPRRDADGNVAQWYGTVEDINERHQAEERYNRLQSELIHVSRGSAMGAMASTLAHELNQPLTAIANYVRGSRRMVGALTGEGVQSVLDALGQADTSVIKAVEVVRRLREMAAHNQDQRRAENLPDLIREASKVALADAGALDIAYKIDLDPHAKTVFADRIQIHQVLTNLLSNAVEALTPNGMRRIAIQTKLVGDTCEISVRDTGSGVSPQAAPRLFEPFNSTKLAGLGIGLSISRTIVEAHGGQIWHEARPGGGAIFRFTLPCAPAARQPAVAPAQH